MKKPLISVVMATFNEPPEYITQSIQSILNQTLGDFELLLIDDSTNPDTMATIDGLAQSDSRIKLIREKQRIGFVRALNVGLKQAQGIYIARMDGDDISLPRRFELQVAYMETHPDIAVVGGAMDIMNKKGEIVSHRNYATTSFGIRLFALMRNPLAHPSIMMRQQLVENGFCYDETFNKTEDMELWLRLMKKGYKISNIPNALILYRIIDNIADKRIGDNFKYAYKARTKNFSWRYPLWSLTSLLIAKIYTLLPKKIVTTAYKIENKNV
ncbi:MAG: glycosyltransferase [Prevotellaceae bacterium]|jgi:glycosyltransferase involved in cell wall biosynthesis|nr:glycosyltransferase [Prevotellaceae bacterium]